MKKVSVPGELERDTTIQNCRQAHMELQEYLDGVIYLKSTNREQKPMP